MEDRLPLNAQSAPGGLSMQGETEHLSDLRSGRNNNGFADAFPRLEEAPCNPTGREIQGYGTTQWLGEPTGLGLPANPPHPSIQVLRVGPSCT